MKKQELPLLAAAFLLPVLLALAACAVLGLAPFGSGSLAVYDAQAQYLSYYAFLEQVEQAMAETPELVEEKLGEIRDYFHNRTGKIILACNALKVNVEIIAFYRNITAGKKSVFWLTCKPVSEYLIKTACRTD